MNQSTAVRALAYVGFAVEEPDAWFEFAINVMGLMPSADKDGPRRLRVDHRAWRIAVTEGSANDIVFAGFEVSGESELSAMQAHLSAMGINVTEDDGTLARDRGVTRLIRCTDPTGIEVELFYGAMDRFDQPFVSPQAVSGFVTGDQGLGHIVLGSEDVEAMRNFYTAGLGFLRSDLIRMPFGPMGVRDLEFYHCNPRHHTLALVPFARPRRIFHFMLQASSFDDVGFALDRFLNADAKITATLGRHTNDHMISFYAETPCGIEVEYGFGARTIDDSTWTEALHDKPSIWGHKRG